MRLDIKINPKILKGTVDVNSSKSHSHRLLICAAFADRPTEIVVGGMSEDIEATIRCLKALGTGIHQDDRGNLQVIPSGETILELPVVDCGESGSTLRFLLPVAAALGGPALFTGRGRLPYRPLSPLVEALTSHGCSYSLMPFNDADGVNEEEPRCLPAVINGKLQGGTFLLPGNVSSQFLSGLLLAFPLLEKGSKIRLTTEIQSKGYLDMTVDAMARFGAEAISRSGGYRLEKPQGYRSPGTIRGEGDWSNAAFWVVAGALSGPVECRGLSSTSLQGDKAIVQLLTKAGADVCWQHGKLLSSRGESGIIPLEVDVGEIPDLVPVLSVAAAGAEGVTRIYNGERLRIKESDRLKSTAAMINSLGGRAEETADGLLITGNGRLSGGVVDSAGDHRIAMAAGVASILCDKPVSILGAEAVNKSYPDFFEDFKLLGGMVDVVNIR